MPGANRLEITLEAFRESMHERLRQSLSTEADEAIRHFLSCCDRDHVPGNAIVVIEVDQPLRLLADDDGYLLGVPPVN